jgi:hypothetical protein
MKIKQTYVCPTCKGRYANQSEAIDCRNKHAIITEKWLMCKCGFGVRWFDNHTFESCKMSFDYHQGTECSCRKALSYTTR